MTFTWSARCKTSGHAGSSSLCEQLAHSSMNMADRSSAHLLSTDWITAAFPAAAGDIWLLLSSKIRWSSGLPDCPAPSDLMAYVELGENAALTEWGSGVKVSGLQWVSQPRLSFWVQSDLWINRPKSGAASINLQRADGANGNSHC